MVLCPPSLSVASTGVLFSVADVLLFMGSVVFISVLPAGTVVLELGDVL